MPILICNCSYCGLPIRDTDTNVEFEKKGYVHTGCKAVIKKMRYKIALSVWHEYTSLYGSAIPNKTFEGYIGEMDK